MAQFSGNQFALLLVNQFNLISSLSESATMGKESITQPTHPFGAASEQNSPVGLAKGVLEVGGGVFDATTDALHAVTGSSNGVERVVSAAIEGNVIGKHFMGFQGALDISYMVKDRVDGLTMADVKYLVTGDVDEGVIIQSLATFTATWDTKTGGANATDAPVDYTTDTAQRVIPIASATKANPCVVTTSVEHGLTTGQKVLMSGNTLAGPAINSDLAVTVLSTTTYSVAVNTTASSGAGTGGTFVLSSTVGGGVGYQHCTELTVTSLANKIMHSPDDSTYAALVTFTTLTAVGKERKTYSGTCDRYTSNQGTVVGAGNVTVFSGLCRL